MRSYHDHNSNRQKVCVIREMDETPPKFKGKLHPKNLESEKEKFFREGASPMFDLKDTEAVNRIASRDCAQIRFDHLEDAKWVLQTVKDKFGDGSAYVERAFGRKIDHVKASQYIAEYLSDSNLEGEITTYWTPELVSSAKMMWHGLNTRYNKPEARTFSLIIKNCSDNQYLREQGIKCLADHEIGTHYFRMYNDGFQPWYADKKVFGLRGRHSRDLMASEEGLACLHTAFNAHEKFLWFPALLYYTACLSQGMSFKELYDHLKMYIADCDQRWRMVMRVKRGLKNPNDPGGIGIDQCYFEGACKILRNIDNIDFNILYSGKICVDEVYRVRRLARMDCLRLPYFLGDIEKYKRTLTHMAIINGLIPAPKPPPERRMIPKACYKRAATATPLRFGSPFSKLSNNWCKTPTPPPSYSKTPTPPISISTKTSSSSIISSMPSTSSQYSQYSQKGDKRSFFSRQSAPGRLVKKSSRDKLRKKGKKLIKRPSSHNCLKAPKESKSSSKVVYFGSLQRTIED